MPELVLRNGKIKLPISYADEILLGELQNTFKAFQGFQDSPDRSLPSLDPYRLTFLIQRICEDSHDRSLFNVSMRHAADGSTYYEGKALHLYVEELDEILNTVTGLYFEILADRKKSLLSTSSDKLTAQEKAEARNRIAELERHVKNQRERLEKDRGVGIRFVLLQEGVAPGELDRAWEKVKEQEKTESDRDVSADLASLRDWAEKAEESDRRKESIPVFNAKKGKIGSAPVPTSPTPEEAAAAEYLQATRETISIDDFDTIAELQELEEDRSSEFLEGYRAGGEEIFAESSSADERIAELEREIARLRGV